MILFWLLAGLIASGAVLLILARAARAEGAAGAPDPAFGVYQRQLSEIDELAERGLLGPEEHRSARAEAGRRLLGHADAVASEAPAPAASSGRGLVLAGAVAAPVLALIAYVLIGSPGLPDQPYKERLKAWRQAADIDPTRLNVAETIAVLEAMAAERPTQAQPWIFIGRLKAGTGDGPGALRALQRAAALEPRRAEVWSMMGQTLVVISGGEVTPEARSAFEQAVALDPSDPDPRYFLGRADIAAGRAEAGLKTWRALLEELPGGDARRRALREEIARVEANGGALPAAAAEQAPEGAGEQAAFIQGMVDRLAARLQTQPDDPAGWARLIRAYGVLGQKDRQDAALARARGLFKDRPADLRTALATAP